MRSVEDAYGITWDVAVGKESYGIMVLLFSRRGACEVRRLQIDSSSRLEAERMLSALDADTLRDKLTVASVLTPGPHSTGSDLKGGTEP